MAVFRVERNHGYTVMCNHHLRDINLSLKAKGLLSLMLSLPENWDYTTKGLAAICKDGVDSIQACVRELEQHGYVIRERIRGEDGRLGAIEYTILEQPRLPEQENPVLDKPEQGKHAQYIDRTNLKKDLNNKRNIVSYPIRDDAMRNDGFSFDANICREQIKANIEYDILQSEMSLERDLLPELLDLIVDTVCTTKETVRISGTDYPADQVKKRFLELRADHIRYVCDCMKETTTKIRNIRQYLLAALYYAPTTIHSYYAAQVRHDFENNAYD